MTEDVSQKTRIGRPALPRHMKRSSLISFRVTESDRALIDEFCRARGISYREFFSPVVKRAADLTGDLF